MRDEQGGGEEEDVMKVRKEKEEGCHIDNFGCFVHLLLNRHTMILMVSMNKFDCLF